MQKWTWTGARFTKQNPRQKQLAAPNLALLLIRARYYDPNLGEFISRDPLEFVDGMSLYRAYFVPGAMDPFGLFCIVKGNVKLDLTTTFSTGAGLYHFDVSAQSLVDYLADKAKDKIWDQIKERFWKLLRDQISGNGIDLLDAINDAADKFGTRNKRAKLEGLLLSRWSVRPKYTIEYELLCCTAAGGKLSTDRESGTAGPTKGKSLIGKFYRGNIHLNDPDDRATLIKDIGDEFKAINSKTSLPALRAEAIGVLTAHVTKNSKCCVTPQVIELGGLGRPEANLTSWE